ncbi:ferredoxin--NADP reductase [Sediminitomix flava]|uniref:Ring-1,2-phenylacetyl-CoA epoxidase subunit PaaE n=1 Tax=Sediminitomix flava TaxID=379075 RepID=A0A315Z909_SEDFL|nr:ferredoxin--NADP reductase [Sediminitomix flava]PWJ41045.1 ring-1,2-phenylacetyl-CoA epoxidase subunit PaaE [Sediminitomix flava]
MANYYTLKIKEVVQETSDTITIHFKQPIFKKVKYKAGQYLTLLTPINGNTERRSYSMSSNPDTDSTVAITVKRVEGGLVSNHLNDQVKQGDSLEIMEPMGNFLFEPDADATRHVVLFGAGSGITPLMSILKSVLYKEPNSRVSLIYGSRNEESIIFKAQLDKLQAEFSDRFTLVNVLSQPSADWGGYHGRVDSIKTINIMNLLPKFDKSLYYLCGPEGMMEEVQNGLKRLQVSTSDIHYERFVAAEEQESTEGEFKDQVVKINLDDEIYEVNVPAGTSILDAALDEGVDLPYSCQSGVCTACMGRCKTGEIHMQDGGQGLTDAEKAEGYVLTCVSHPLGEDIEIEFD